MGLVEHRAYRRFGRARGGKRWGAPDRSQGRRHGSDSLWKKERNGAEKNELFSPLQENPGFLLPLVALLDIPSPSSPALAWESFVMAEGLTPGSRRLTPVAGVSMTPRTAPDLNIVIEN